MQNNSSQKNDALLGFTLAEVMILLLFLLFLLLAYTLYDKFLQEEQTEMLESKVDNLETLVKTAIEDSGSSASQSVDELFKELVMLQEYKTKNQEMQSQLTKLEEDSIELEILKKQIDNQDLTTLANEKAIADNEIKTLEGQIKYLQNKYGVDGVDGVGGRGVEMPPCWANPNTGRVEYIFNVTITSDGVIVKDNKIPHRVQDQANLPIKNMVFDKVISNEDFVSQTIALFQWSVARECRFFVRIYDETASDEKELYKASHQAITSNFYHWEQR